ncbi:MAG: hypothetical protein CR217_00955 [Beijerinckiaceae bacterium]|nr:MAG: hypothetical protein CR217_00955 [Beijerinckiaceae bacterium]
MSLPRRSPCNLGGCGFRVTMLSGGVIFACWHCYRLAYASSREDLCDRLARRADRLRARLDWEPGILNGNGAGVFLQIQHP